MYIARLEIVNVQSEIDLEVTAESYLCRYRGTFKSFSHCTRQKKKLFPSPFQRHLGVDGACTHVHVAPWHSRVAFPAFAIEKLIPSSEI